MLSDGKDSPDCSSLFSHRDFNCEENAGINYSKLSLIFFFQISRIFAGTQTTTLQNVYAPQILFWSVFIAVSPLICWNSSKEK